VGKKKRQNEILRAPRPKKCSVLSKRKRLRKKEIQAGGGGRKTLGVSSGPGEETVTKSFGKDMREWEGQEEARTNVKRGKGITIIQVRNRANTGTI